MNCECCICLEYLNTDIHVLKCCFNDIHTKCIYEMFVFADDFIFKCPLCRTCEKFNCILTLKDIKKYTNNCDIIDKYKENVNESYENENEYWIGFILQIIFLFILIIVIFSSFILSVFK